MSYRYTAEAKFTIGTGGSKRIVYSADEPETYVRERVYELVPNDAMLVGIATWRGSVDSRPDEEELEYV